MKKDAQYVVDTLRDHVTPMTAYELLRSLTKGNKKAEREMEELVQGCVDAGLVTHAGIVYSGAYGDGWVDGFRLNPHII
jgi:hypothetical protein